MRSPITTHILDTAWGNLFEVSVVLSQKKYRLGRIQIRSTTNADGRV